MKKFWVLVLAFFPILFAANMAKADEPLVVIALVKVKPGMEDAFREAASRILGPTRSEAGNLVYDFQQSVDDPLEFSTYEQWKSVADLDSHMTTAHMQQFFGIVGPMFAEGYPQIKKYRRFGN